MRLMVQEINIHVFRLLDVYDIRFQLFVTHFDLRLRNST